MDGRWMEFFIYVINAGYQAGIAVCFVLLARMFLGWLHLPKYRSRLWAIPFGRLLFPMLLPASRFCVLPVKPISEELFIPKPAEEAAAKSLDQAVQSVVPVVGTQQGDSMQLWMTIACRIWLAGIVFFLLYAALATLFLKYRLRASVRECGNIYLADGIDSPFVMGVCMPRIYLPSDLSEEVKGYVILHERQHIAESDPLRKIVVYLLLAVYWFHPLLWVAYFYFNKDMEHACDEAVTKSESLSFRRQYAKALLSLSIKGRRMAHVPIACFEGSPKARIRHIMHIGTTPFWVTGIGIFVVFVLVLGLWANPVAETSFREREFLRLSQQEEEIEVKAPVVDLSASVGDGVRLYYADAHNILFGGSFGLFVYAKPQQKIVRGLDVASIGCGRMQGEDGCEIRVSQFGTEVYLHPANSDQMYVWCVEENTLDLIAYDLEGTGMYQGIRKDGAEALFKERGQEALCSISYEDTIGSVSWSEQGRKRRFFSDDGTEADKN